jgi:hypothetical protein
MEKLSDIFNHGDIYHLKQEALRKKRSYNYDQATESNIQKPKRARFKLQVYFRNGKKRYFYSLDYVFNPQGGISHVDEFEGAKWLWDFVTDNIEEIKTATLYYNGDPNPLTSSKHYNVKVWTLGLHNWKYQAVTKSIIEGKNIFMKCTPLIRMKYEPRLSV